MEFTNYILEAAGVSDVDIMDIEVTQAMAEMAVLEAMMDCYEKQMVLLEYNEDSADEIFNEAEIFIPEMSEFIQEARVEYHDLKMKHGWKIVHDTDAGNKDGKGKNGQGLWYLYGVDENGLELVFGPYDSKQQLIFNARNNKQARAGYGKHNIAENRNRIAELKKKINEGKAQEEAAPVSVERAVSGSTAGQQPAPAPGTTAAAEPDQSPKSNKQADQWDGSSAVSTASKSFKNSFKKFMSKAGSVIQQLVLGLVDSVFSVNFDKLADKIGEKGAGFTMNDKQFQTVNRLEDLMDITTHYYGNFESTLLSRVNWTRAEVNKYKNALTEYSSMLKQKYVDAGVFNNTTEQVNSPNKQTTPEDLIELCHKLGKNDVKKLLRKCQKEAAAYNTDFNENANIPPEIGKAMRTFVNDLIKVYNKTTKDFKVMLNWALEVGAAQQSRNKNGGIDQSPIGFKKSPAAKELQQQRRAARKAMRNGAAAVDMYENLGGKEEAEGWAEEGWSMNLSEDEDFF